MTSGMMMGGIEKALIAMLEQIPKEKYEITLLLEQSGGELYNNIPANVNVEILFNHKIGIIENAWRYLLQGNIIKSYSVILNVILLKRGISSELDESINYYKINFLKKNYDVAIAYSSLMSIPVIYVCNNIKAKKITLDTQ